MKKIILIILFIPLLSHISFSQNGKDTTKNTKNIIDVHLVAGLNNGLRAGLRYHFLNKYSIELDYGFPISSFGGDSYNIYELGLNMYPFKENSILCGLMLTYYHRPERFNNRYNAFGFTPYIGFLAERDNWFMFHARGGMHIRYLDFPASSNHFYMMVDLEIGFAIDLF